MSAVLAPSRFEPHPWLQRPLAQMVAGAFLRSRAPLPQRVERLTTPDGDFVELGWLHEAPRGPIALLVHGIGGGLRSGYAHAMAGALAALGWTSAVLQLRGAGREPCARPLLYHHGDTEDLRWVAGRLRRQHPRRPLVAVGWSLGGSIVLNALGEEGARSPLQAAAVVSAPLRLRECAEFLCRGPARFYQSLMLGHVKRLLRPKLRHRHWPKHLDREAILRARDFLELGDAYTAPLCGFRDALDYCECADPGRRLPRIRRPTLILQARDDPFLGPAALPAAPGSPDVRIELAARGGHVGFVCPDERGRPRSWLEPRIARFLQSALRRGPRTVPRTRRPP